MIIIKRNEYPIGARVKIVDKWNDKTNEETLYGVMDKWLGQIMTISEYYDNVYSMQEDKEECLGGWSWNEYCIEGQIIEDVSIGDYVLIGDTHNRIRYNILRIKDIKQESPNFVVEYQNCDYCLQYEDIIDVAKLQLRTEFQTKFDKNIYIRRTVKDYSYNNGQIVYVDEYNAGWTYDYIKYVFINSGRFKRRKKIYHKKEN